MITEFSSEIDVLKTGGGQTGPDLGTFLAYLTCSLDISCLLYLSVRSVEGI